MRQSRWVCTVMLLVIPILASCASSSDTPGAGSSTSTSVPPSTTGPSTTTSPTSAPAATTVACQTELLTQPADTSLSFYALCNVDFGLYPVYRPTDTPHDLNAALAALVTGTTPEEQALGLSTGFDFVEEADEIVVMVNVDRNGTARVDFQVDGERWDPGSRASTSHQLFSFLDPLYGAVFSDPSVAALDRSTLCWGESDCAGAMTRTEWEGILFANHGTLTHGGCTAELARWYPDECTLDGVVGTQGVRAAPVVDVESDDVLNVRTGPGSEYPRHGEVAPGDTVEATPVSAVAADGGIWQLTQLGWVNSAFLDLPDECEPAPMAAIATRAIGAATLTEVDASFEESAEGGIFGPRTTDPEALAIDAGLGCSWQATQRFGATERLVVAAWVGDRFTMVIQATDEPAEPYRQEGGPDMEIKAVSSERMAEDTWAMTLPGGDSLVLVASNPDNLAWLAKLWVTHDDFNCMDCGQYSTTTEEMALPALRAAGAGAVSIAEPSEGSLTAVVSLVSPRGDDVFVSVGPTEAFDPLAAPPEGAVFFADVDGVPVRLVAPASDGATSVAAFHCDGFGWSLAARDGTIVETYGFVARLIKGLGCT